MLVFLLIHYSFQLTLWWSPPCSNQASTTNPHIFPGCSTQNKIHIAPKLKIKMISAESILSSSSPPIPGSIILLIISYNLSIFLCDDCLKQSILLHKFFWFFKYFLLFFIDNATIYLILFQISIKKRRLVPKCCQLL